MPAISRFYGIVIEMYWDEHPPPHLHARHGDARVTIQLDDASALRGRLPPRAARMLRHWVAAHRRELLDNWERGRRMAPMRPVEPLD